MPVFTSSIEVTADYPTIKPSLNLNFARSRSLDPRITFTRASTATYVGRDGLIKTAGVDEARFDHDPETLESLGLLIEESRTNFALDSNDYSINTSSINASITTNVITAPDGTLTADMITASAGNAQHGSTKNTTGLPINSVCSLSIFVKAGTNNYCRLDEANVTNWSASSSVVVNLTNGSIISGSGTVEPYPNGWYRITIYPTSNSTAGVLRGMWVWVCGSNGNSTYNAVGTETIHVWGAQLEAGSFPTSYIPTAGSSVTRAVDSADIIGSSFSSFYNPIESTILVDVKANIPVSVGGQRNIFHLGNDNSDGYGFFKEGGGLNKFFHIRSGGGTIQNFDSNVDFPFKTTVKFGAAFTNGDQAVYFDDQLRTGTSTTSGISSANITALNIGASNTQGANSWTGTISKLVYYPKRLTNTQLQLLTS